MPDHLSDPVAGHVPDALCYGPVWSRRFGRSLGVSLSDPADPVRCHWHCPYCQLGRQRSDGPPTPARRIIAAVTAKLAELAPGSVDAVTFAGNGEPLDHPEFSRIAVAIAPLAAVHGAQTVLLTNGDGIDRPEVMAALLLIGRTYVKWDPGASGGAWRRPSGGDPALRLRTLRSIPSLRIQAMLFQDERGDGNAGDEACQRWLREMVYLRPVEVHLTTIERDPANPHLRPVPPVILARWRRETERVIGPGVTSFASRRIQESPCIR